MPHFVTIIVTDLQIVKLLLFFEITPAQRALNRVRHFFYWIAAGSSQFSHKLRNAPCSRGTTQRS